MSRPQEEEKVGVVVPMFNAEGTIAATLDSICRQTHATLDIVVVDDGSRDGSPAIVRDKARSDPRIRLIGQQNAGVAAARNLGAAATDAPFLAFIDADDLWAPTKIASQLAALARGGSGAGLAYCWFATIDAADRVVSFGPQPLIEGDAIPSLCSGNWIGNGSSVLVRRDAFEKAGGYELGLREREAQGAEDLLLCLRVAEHAGFAVVPRYLVGYRTTPGNMSSNSLKMFRSTEIVLAEFRTKYPAHAAALAHHQRDARHWFIYRALASGRYGDARVLLGEALRTHPLASTRHLGGLALGIARGRMQRRFGATPPLPLYTEAIW
ncbi:glycosyltransferase family 2 protein [Reyranella sp.]|uniref:glycosyltransferase family 2 protein n=1 Tax=Reyranella sp. TaxID=1929291 RepID=UPI003BAA46DF